MEAPEQRQEAAEVARILVGFPEYPRRLAGLVPQVALANDVSESEPKLRRRSRQNPRSLG